MSDPINWTQQRKRLADLTPWPRNPRQIKTPQAKRLLQSVQEFGQVETLAIGPDGDIYNGHQRLAVLMKRYGPDYEVDVRVSSRPLSEKEREKLTVYLHKGAAGEWDFDVLANEFEIAELIEWGFDAAELGIDLTGGTDDDAEPQIDRAEELREQWGVEPGQMWRLPSRTPGQEHRLICGDCTDAAVVERVMGGERADMILTDPPYGVEYEGGSGNESKRERLRGDRNTSHYAAFLETCLPRKTEKAAVYLWFAGSKGRPVYDAVEDSGLTVRALLFWNKTNAHFGGYMAQYMEKKEPLLYCVSGSTNWYGPTNEVTVWDIDQPAYNEHHPTEKPLECMERPMRNSTERADIVLDPFLGSGTTIIAAENLARQCRAVEISPAYIAVALQRYVDAFGIEPELVTE